MEIWERKKSMSTSQKIGTIEAIALIVIIIINQIILNLPNTIITSTGSSSWLNVIYITIIAIIFCSLICKLFKPFNSLVIYNFKNIIIYSF